MKHLCNYVGCCIGYVGFNYFTDKPIEIGTMIIVSSLTFISLYAIERAYKALEK